MLRLLSIVVELSRPLRLLPLEWQASTLLEASPSSD